MYEIPNLSMEEVTKKFCDYFGAGYTKITMPKFIKILQYCWEANVDMNFDNNPDWEDLEFLRGQDYMKTVLYEISQHYYSGGSSCYGRGTYDKWFDNIRRLLKNKPKTDKEA